MERTESKDLRFLSQKLRKIFADGTPKFAKKNSNFLMELFTKYFKWTVI